MSFFLSERQFKEEFSFAFRHKKASQLLRKAFHQDPNALHDYRHVEFWLQLSSLDITNFEEVADRYHDHLRCAGENLKEHNYLSRLLQCDKMADPLLSEEGFLPIAIYLDNLRSAFNVGGILRTTEALRLGKVYFGKNTPFVDNPKVYKTSMGTDSKVFCYKISDLDVLPRPWVGLETVHEASNIHSFAFPKEFTLFLGNEEYGLSEEVLQGCDHLVKIPMHGFKNSLNVACAFSIAAAEIRRQHAHSGMA
jgi:tRNA G18 (ribose-2'-O)-methylase SpoU